MRIIEILESNVVDLSTARKERAKDKVSGLVSGFQAYLDNLEQYKALFGRFQPMLDEYEGNPSPAMVPSFFIEIEFDGRASKKSKDALETNGFTIMNDEPEWGTEIHDDEGKSWSHGAYSLPDGKGGSKPLQKNWYTQSSAWKEITVDEAKAMFAHRSEANVTNVYGLYRPQYIHYKKGDLQGDSVKGWDIKTHPDYEKHFSKKKSWRIEFRAEDYSRDAAIENGEQMTEALRVLQAITQGERIRKSGATNVSSIR